MIHPKNSYPGIYFADTILVNHRTTGYHWSKPVEEALNKRFLLKYSATRARLFSWDNLTRRLETYSSTGSDR